MEAFVDEILDATSNALADIGGDNDAWIERNVEIVLIQNLIQLEAIAFPT